MATGELVKSRIWYLFKPVIMCKEGWYVGLGQKGGCLREGGGNCQEYLKIPEKGVE